jgi:hypothetical protein
MATQFISRIATWIANEVVTKRLANSPHFIDAAHKLHKNVSSAAVSVNRLVEEQQRKVLKDAILKQPTSEKPGPISSGKMFNNRRQ